MSGARKRFQADFGVSRETMERFDIYLALLEKWTARINLVSRSTLPDAWTRHFADSAQLWSLAEQAGCHWIDLGSGAGFPGLVVAILAEQRAQVTLVESDQRKAAFLTAVAQAIDLPVLVLSERAESLTLPASDVVSARALAPLDTLLGYAEKLRSPTGICLFPKGQTVHNELAEAARRWQFAYRVHPSRTDPKAAIVEIGALARV